jgi:hypothetical protein
MQLLHKAIVAAVVLAGGATCARAADPSELIANAHASSVGGCNGCGVSQDQTLLTSSNSMSVVSTATDAPAGSSSFAHAWAKTTFGTQHVYADAFLAAGDANPDAQAVGFSRYVEYFDAGSLGSTPTISFIITGSHTPNAGVIGPGSDAELNWDLIDATTNFGIASGSWSATDAPPTPVVNTYAVPLTDVLALRVDFSASAYAGQRTNPYVVFADYRHTVHTYIAGGAGDVIGRSGHDYAAPVAGGVPEPTAWVFMILGVAASGAMHRRRNVVAAAA